MVFKMFLTQTETDHAVDRKQSDAQYQRFCLPYRSYGVIEIT